MSEMKENKKMPCAVARDLMPLYVENLTEEETAELMREHIAECAACAQSFGMQKTKLEIEKKPQRPDWRGVRFFKKSFLKRVALWMAIAIMSFVIIAAGSVYVFQNHDVDREDIRVVGQYELTDGSIVIALQAEGCCINNTRYSMHEWPDYGLYEYDENGYRVICEQERLCMDADVYLMTDRFTLWTRKTDERGEIFYYMFDADAQSADQYRSQGFIVTTPVPVEITAVQTEEKASDEENTLQPYLQSLRVNDKLVWRAGDPLRKLTAEEEEVLLRAMETAGFLNSAALLPEEDILDTLMGK